MKKIFAIALALVMVLSMASAFAAASMPGTCDWGTWDCTTYTSKCGIAKAEVVKFVRTNDCDPFVQSDCAAVVKDLPVYYAVKVVFDENVNEQWFNHKATKLTVAVKNMTIVTAPADKKLSDMAAYDDVKKGGTFWVTKTGTLVKDADFATTDCVFEGIATSTGVKVCANVEFLFDGKDAAVQLGKYVAKYYSKEGYIRVIDQATKDEAKFYIVDGKLNSVWVAATGKDYIAYVDGMFYGWDANNQKYFADADTCNYLKDMIGFLGLKFGDCVTDEGIKNFFGWDDDDAFEFCVTWDKNAQAVVNSECVVMGIPKTGDASVLAWLF